MGLCTQADVEKVLQISFTNPADPTVAFNIAAATAVIESFCHRTFTGATHVETLDGTGAPWLFLAYPPVTALTSIVEDGTTLTATQYKWYDSGRIVRMSGDTETDWTDERQAVVVSYTGGWTPIPADLAYCCACVAARGFRIGYAASESPNPTLTLERIGDYMAQWKQGVEGQDNMALTLAEKRLLRRYQRTIVAGGG